jgi:hypothetical protein
VKPERRPPIVCVTYTVICIVPSRSNVMARPLLGWSFALPLAWDFHIPTKGFPGGASGVTCFALVSSEARNFHPPTAQIRATNRTPTITQCDVRIGSPVLTIELIRSYRIEDFQVVYAL